MLSVQSAQLPPIPSPTGRLMARPPPKPRAYAELATVPMISKANAKLRFILDTRGCFGEYWFEAAIDLWVSRCGGVFTEPEKQALLGLCLFHVHEHRGFIFGEVVEARVEDDVLLVFDDPGDALSFLV